MVLFIGEFWSTVSFLGNLLWSFMVPGMGPCFRLVLLASTLLEFAWSLHLQETCANEFSFILEWAWIACMYGKAVIAI